MTTYYGHNMAIIMTATPAANPLVRVLDNKLGKSEEKFQSSGKVSTTNELGAQNLKTILLIGNDVSFIDIG
jgi:hypothetical protein